MSANQERSDRRGRTVHVVEITDTDAREVVRRHLGSDEQLVWVGRPETGWRLGPADRFLIPFGIFWVAFVIFWEAAALIGALARRDG